MTTRELFNKRKRRLILSAWIGILTLLMLFIGGDVASSFLDLSPDARGWIFKITGLAGLVVCVTIVRGFCFGWRCPFCHEALSANVIMGGGVDGDYFSVPKHLTCCTRCGESLDKEIPAAVPEYMRE